MVEILDNSVSKASCPVRPIPAYKEGLYDLTKNRQLSESNSKPPFIPVHRTGFSGCLNKKLSRREFLKGAGVAIAAAGLESMLSACTLHKYLTFSEPSTVIYPPLSGHKVQPPQDGCYIGFFRLSTSWGQPINIDPDKYYEDRLGKKPAILVSIQHYLPIFYPGFKGEYWAKKGIINLVYGALDGMQFRNALRGSIDEDLKQAAEGAVQFGEQYGGFLFAPMQEMNGSWFHWGQQSSYAKVWRHMWEHFEAKGANKYVTWLWEFYCQNPGIRTNNIDDPERYYPGDRFVDWIGMSTYNRDRYRVSQHPLRDLIWNHYVTMRKRHPTKPIILAEFGKTVGSDQALWIRDAYNTIRSISGLKGAIYFDNVNYEEHDDHRLTSDVLAELREILADSHYIMAK